MLDQKRTGMFILELRKEKGYTQKQLADRIGVSDKAISRWETGRGLPDTSIMPALCEALSSKRSMPACCASEDTCASQDTCP